jgi:NADH-quinone oxidoreductase subunit F
MNNKNTITVGLGSCGIASGAQDVYEHLASLIKEENINVNLEKVGCIGMCYREPIVELKTVQGKNIMYEKVDIEQATKIIEDQILQNKAVKEMEIDLDQENKDGIFAKQNRIALRNCGIVNPESIDDYTQTEIKSRKYQRKNM